MSEINDKLSFNKWYAPLDKPLKDKFKDLIVLSNPKLSANPTNFFTDDKNVIEVKGESKEQTRWRLVNEWKQKLEVMDTSPVATKEEERGDITDITDIPETEVVNDIPTPPKPKDIEVAKDVSAEQEAEDIATTVDNKQEAEPVLSQPCPEVPDVLAKLGTALHAFIASTDSPPEDTPSVGDSSKKEITEVIMANPWIKNNFDQIYEMLDKIEKKQKSLFNAMRDL